MASPSARSLLFALSSGSCAGTVCLVFVALDTLKTVKQLPATGRSHPGLTGLFRNMWIGQLPNRAVGGPWQLGPTASCLPSGLELEADTYVI